MSSAARRYSATMSNSSDDRAYKLVRAANVQRQIWYSCDRRLGAKALARTTRDLMSLYPGSLPGDWFRLMSLEDAEQPLQRLLDEWTGRGVVGVSRMIELRGVWAIARWAYGNALGYLNELDSQTNSLAANQLLQLPNWMLSRLQTPRKYQPSQARLAYRWFSDWLLLSDLELGFAPRPFNPIRGGLWDEERPTRNSRVDAAAVDESFTFVVRQQGLSVAEALQAVRDSPLEVASYQTKAELGTELMVALSE